MAYGKFRKYRRKRSGRRSLKRKAPPVKAVVPKRTRYSKAVRAPSRYKLSRPLRYLVDKQINRHLESKVIRFSAYPVTSGAGSAAYTLRPAITELNMAILVPQIRHANTIPDITAENGPVREGNQINPKWLSIIVTVFQDPSDTNQGVGAGDRGQIQPYIFIGESRSLKNVPALINNNWDDVKNNFWVAPDTFATPNDPSPNFYSGDGHQFEGERWQFLQGSLNTKALRPHMVKAPKLVREVGYTSNPVPGDGDAGWNSRYISRTYRCRIPCPKVLKYENNTSLYPQNFAPFMAIGFTYMNGAAPNEQAPLRCESQVKFIYTDA